MIDHKNEAGESWTPRHHGLFATNIHSADEVGRGTTYLQLSLFPRLPILPHPAYVTGGRCIDLVDRFETIAQLGPGPITLSF
jgi:hypothetical protein